MSTVTMQVQEDRLNLWTNVTSWNPDEKFENNQRYSQLPSKLSYLFYKFKDDEVAELSTVTSVSIPFAYWRGRNTDCPSKACPYLRGNWSRGQAPDIFGRFVIEIKPSPEEYYSTAYKADCHSQILKDIGYTLGTLKKRLRDREGYRNRLFSTFIPLSTRNATDILNSLFPWTQMTYEYDRSTPLRFIADLITLPSRALLLLPRLIYQHLFSQPTLEEVTVEEGGAIDWKSGALHIYGASYGTSRNADNRGGGPKPLDYLNCLGGGEGASFYLG